MSNSTLFEIKNKKYLKYLNWKRKQTLWCICERISFGMLTVVPLWSGWIGLLGECANGGLLLPKKWNAENRFWFLLEWESILSLKKKNFKRK